MSMRLIRLLLDHMESFPAMVPPVHVRKWHCCMMKEHEGRWC